MKLLMPPEIEVESVEIGHYSVMELMLEALPFSTYKAKPRGPIMKVAGRQKISRITIWLNNYETPFELGVKIDELVLDGYRLLGVLPVKYFPATREVECYIDHFEVVNE